MGKEDKITPSQRLLELIRKSSGAAGTVVPGASNAGQAVRRPTVGPLTAGVAQPDPVAPAATAAKEAAVPPAEPTTVLRIDAPADALPEFVNDPRVAGHASGLSNAGPVWPGFGEIPPASPAEPAAEAAAAGPGGELPLLFLDLEDDGAPADASVPEADLPPPAEDLPELVLDLDAAPTAHFTPEPVAPVLDAAVETTPLPGEPVRPDQTAEGVSPGGELPLLFLDLEDDGAPAGASVPEADLPPPAEDLPELVLELDATPTAHFTPEPVAPVLDVAVETTPLPGEPVRPDQTAEGVSPDGALPLLFLDLEDDGAPAGASVPEADLPPPAEDLPELVLDLDAAPTAHFTPEPVAPVLDAAVETTPIPGEPVRPDQMAEDASQAAFDLGETSGTAGAAARPDALATPEADAVPTSAPSAESAPVAAAELAAAAAQAGLAAPAVVPADSASEAVGGGAQKAAWL